MIGGVDAQSMGQGAGLILARFGNAVRFSLQEHTATGRRDRRTDQSDRQGGFYECDRRFKGTHLPFGDAQEEDRESGGSHLGLLDHQVS
jgi:hypothetical protein